MSILTEERIKRWSPPALYLLITVISSLFGGCLCYSLGGFFGLLCGTVLSLILTAASLWIFLPRLIREADESLSDFDKFLWFILPGELVRYITTGVSVSLFSFGRYFMDGWLALWPTSVTNMLTSDTVIADKLYYPLCFVYLFIRVVLMYLLCKLLYAQRLRHPPEEAVLYTEEFNVDTAFLSDQEEEWVRRENYYRSEVTLPYIAGYSLMAILVQLLAYALGDFSITVISYYWGDSALGVVIQALVSLPIVLFLPSRMLRKHLDEKLPPLYSLADDDRVWYRKMLSIISYAEIVRFVMGLMPLRFLRFGITTSPATYMLYSAFYLSPTGRTDIVLTGGGTGYVDILAFVIIYLLYFGLYELWLTRYIRKRILKHRKYLETVVYEYDKSQYYKSSLRGKL